MPYQFASRTAGLRSSAIRDLLKVTEMPDMLSLAGGLPTPDSFPLPDLRREADRLLGECQAVIKPLGPLFERVAGIAGSTILGSGEVALILDVPQLVQRAIAHEGRDTGGAPRARFLAA